MAGVWWDKLSLFLIVWISISIAAWADTAGELVTLRQAIKHSLEKNPATIANALEINAMEDEVRAAWLDLLPRISTSFSQSWLQESGRINAERYSGRGTDKGGYAGISLNLYNGGADVAQARATESRKKSLDALYNSTSQYVPNTRGSIVNSTL